MTTPLPSLKPKIRESKLKIKPKPKYTGNTFSTTLPAYSFSRTLKSNGAT